MQLSRPESTNQPQLSDLPITGVPTDRPLDHSYVYVGNQSALVFDRNRGAARCYFQEGAVVRVETSDAEFRQWSDGFREWEIKCRLLNDIN